MEFDENYRPLVYHSRELEEIEFVCTECCPMYVVYVYMCTHKYTCFKRYIKNFLFVFVFWATPV